MPHARSKLIHPPPKILSPLVNLPFLSSPLAFVPIYLRSRRHPSTPISLFGLVTISAPYLPLALVGVAWMVNGTWKAAAQDLLGCAVGHVGWFMRDVWTREMVGRPTILSDAPDSLYVFCCTVGARLTNVLFLGNGCLEIFEKRIGSILTCSLHPRLYIQPLPAGTLPRRPLIVDVWRAAPFELCIPRTLCGYAAPFF